jgi:antirestriction protein ArdC
MPSQKQIREEITAKIIKALEEGVRPWVRPWSVSPNSGRPASIIGGRPYRGINPMLLELHSQHFGLRSRWWGTFRQWSEILGCTIKKRPADVEPGQWGCNVVLWKPFKKSVVDEETGQQEEQDFLMLRYFTVFNADQVEGPAAEKFQVYDEPANGTVFPDYEPVVDLVAATCARIMPGGDRAYYVRPQPEGSWPNHDSGDFIVLPPKHRYVKPVCYYETLAHELCHWAELRTGWDHNKQGYAMGELAAEIGAAYLCSELGVPCGEDLANHAAYVQSWLEAMKGDASYIFKASTQASKVTDYLLWFVKKEEPVAAETP